MNLFLKAIDLSLQNQKNQSSIFYILQSFQLCQNLNGNERRGYGLQYGALIRFEYWYWPDKHQRQRSRVLFSEKCEWASCAVRYVSISPISSARGENLTPDQYIYALCNS